MANIAKFWSQFWNGHKVQKKYVAFFTVVPLLLLTAFIKKPCPVCNGTGEISTTGMGQVEILNVDASLKSIGVIEGCVNFIAYNYSVTLTLQNSGKLVDASGYVKLGLLDYTTSKTLATQYVLVSVPADMVLTTTFDATFMVGVDAPKTNTQVRADVILNNAPCEACNGTGRVALNQLPLLNAMKKAYAAKQLVSTAPVPPPRVITGETPEEWIGMMGTIDQFAQQHPDYVEP